MNGQKLAQNNSTGDWKTEKVTKAKAIKPGIYNLYNAIDANKTNDNIGEVIHVDKKDNVLYQKNGLQYIKHDLNCFEQIPETGSMINIRYENNRTNITKISNKNIQSIKL